MRTGPKADVPTCPFCNKEGLEVTFEGAVTEEELREQQEEEQKVLELQIRMREEEIKRDRERQVERERRRAAGLPDLGPMTLDANGEIVSAPPPAPEPAPAPASARRHRASHSDHDDDDELALAELLDSGGRLGDLPPGAPGGRLWEMQQLEEIMMSEAIARSMAMEQDAAQAAASAAESTPSEMAATAAADRAATAARADGSLRDDTDALTRQIEQAVRQGAAQTGAQRERRPAPEIAPVSEGADEALLAEAEMDDDLAMALRMSLMSAHELEEAARPAGAANSVDRDLGDSPVMRTPPRISSHTSAQEVKLEASPVGRLPSGWESAVSRRTGEVYFVNTVTGERTFDPPVTTARAKRLGSGGRASADDTTPQGSPTRNASRSPVRMTQGLSAPGTAAAPVAGPGSPVSPLAMEAARTGDTRQWIDGQDDPVQQPQVGAAGAEPPDYVVDAAAYTVDSSDYTVDVAPYNPHAVEPAPEPEQVPSAAPAVVDRSTEQPSETSRDVVVAQFVDVCGTDETTARFTLASVGFDLERAIDRFLTGATPADATTEQQPRLEPDVQLEEDASQPMAVVDDTSGTTTTTSVDLDGDGAVDAPDTLEVEAVDVSSEPRSDDAAEGQADASPTATATSVNLDTGAAVDAPGALEAGAVNGGSFDYGGSAALSDEAAESLQAPPTLAWLDTEDGDDEEDGDSPTAGGAGQRSEVAAPTIGPPEHDDTDVDDEAVDMNADLALALAMSAQLETGGSEVGATGREPSAGATNADIGGGGGAAGSMNTGGARREPAKAWVD